MCLTPMIIITVLMYVDLHEIYFQRIYYKRYYQNYFEKCITRKFQTVKIEVTRLPEL